MKTASISFIIIMLSICCTSFAQINNDTRNVHTDNNQIANRYRAKSHNQKVTSTVLGIGGGALLLTGIALAAASFKGFLQPGVNHPDYGALPDVLAISGGAMIAVAIPYTLAYRRNKKKADLYTQKASAIITPVFTLSTHLTSVGITIRL